jgi:hypothetical protein
MGEGSPGVLEFRLDLLPKAVCACSISVLNKNGLGSHIRNGVIED